MEQMLELQYGTDEPQGSGGVSNFVNANPVWYPSHARGIYGGVLISQSLVAAQKKVPPTHLVQSMKCNFLQSGSNEQRLLYQTRRLRALNDSPIIVTVNVRQKDTLLFIAIVQFARQKAGESDEYAQVSSPKPAPLPPPNDHSDDADDVSRPFLLRERIVSSGGYSQRKSLEKRSWLRSRHHIAERDNVQTHSAALAFMSDSYVITTVAQTMGLKTSHRAVRESERPACQTGIPPPTVSMMVSLDHVIYFHQHNFRADEWIYAEMEGLWAGHGRALVRERMYSPSGVLLATCLQEVRKRDSRDRHEFDR